MLTPGSDDTSTPASNCMSKNQICEQLHFHAFVVCTWQHYQTWMCPPGSILALKKYTFSYVAFNVASFFMMEILDFKILAPPPLENIRATPLKIRIDRIERQSKL